ncbi:MAG: hypothetical protein UHL07_03500, partial [Bacteroidaceae bacterium]|nr:hypothetical protein [Bacteroidaceae bacterium]
KGKHYRRMSKQFVTNFIFSVTLDTGKRGKCFSKSGEAKPAAWPRKTPDAATKSPAKGFSWRTKGFSCTTATLSWPAQAFSQRKFAGVAIKCYLCPTRDDKKKR